MSTHIAHYLKSLGLTYDPLSSQPESIMDRHLRRVADILNRKRYVTPQHESSLIRALTRCGYTFSAEEPISPHYYRDGLGGPGGFSSPMPSMETWQLDCERFKPYWTYSGDDEQYILHEDCTYQAWDTASIHQHQIDFLKQMIPVIGRLDAAAILDPGGLNDRSPRLKINLRLSSFDEEEKQGETLDA